MYVVIYSGFASKDDVATITSAGFRNIKHYDGT